MAPLWPVLAPPGAALAQIEAAIFRLEGFGSSPKLRREQLDNLLDGVPDGHGNECG
jgi:hypothetical protein